MDRPGGSHLADRHAAGPPLGKVVTLPCVFEALRRDIARTIELWDATEPDAAYRKSAWQARTADRRLLTRRGYPAHFTASALPMTADGARACLVLHGRMGLWVQPGGHLEDLDRSVVMAATREMAEETGLVGQVDPTPLNLSRHPAPCRPGAWHLDLQLLAVCEPAAPTISSESRDVAWFDVARLPRETASGVAELIDAGHQRLSRSGSRGQPPSVE
jgi:8-oxo-dGTP pyrophosphatase MutT (NUDIX family)